MIKKSYKTNLLPHHIPAKKIQNLLTIWIGYKLLAFNLTINNNKKKLPGLRTNKIYTF